MIFNLIHTPSETTGLIGNVLKELRIPFKDVHLYEGEGFPRDTSDLEGLIIMGGPMNVDEIDKYPFLFSEVQLIEKVLSENKPTLGICLGSQLIAKALGSKIYPNKFREVGWHPIQPTEAGKNDRLFSLLTAAPSVFHWHGDTFDLPKGAVHLARSQKCENQAFKWGAATYALQFHLEVTPVMVNDWCSSLESESYIHSAGESKEDIVHRTPAAFSKLEPVALSFLNSYTRMAFSKVLSLN